MGNILAHQFNSESVMDQLLMSPLNNMNSISFETSNSTNSDHQSVGSPTSHFSFSNLVSSPTNNTSSSLYTNLPEGLSIILVQETNPLEGIKNIVFPPHFKMININAPISQTPETRDSTILAADHEKQPMDSISPPMILGLTAEDIILSEEYTCVRILHGPNPKVTHIFGDCILECQPFNIFGAPTRTAQAHVANCHLPDVVTSNSRFTDGFLKNCFVCKKIHKEWKEIYIYRDASFCSEECRFEEMLADYHKAMMRRARKSCKSSTSTASSTGQECIFFIGDPANA